MGEIRKDYGDLEEHGSSSSGSPPAQRAGNYKMTHNKLYRLLKIEGRNLKACQGISHMVALLCLTHVWDKIKSIHIWDSYCVSVIGTLKASLLCGTVKI